MVAAASQAPARTCPAMPAGWWPVDKIIVLYLAATAGLILLIYDRLAHPVLILAAHGAAILLIRAYAVHPALPGAAWFRHWYPLPFVSCLYKEMSWLIPAARDRDYDLALARLDYAIWGAHPTVWLERFASPWLTEAEQILYSLFVPAVLAVAVLFWTRRRYAEFRAYALVISAGFLLSYVGYFLVPARGPRFALAAFQTRELAGLFISGWLRRLLDVLESAHYDCFPSGHTALTILAWWYSRRISRRLFHAYSFYTISIVLATVYLRYHYTIDILAGMILAGTVILLAPRPDATEQEP